MVENDKNPHGFNAHNLGISDGYDSIVGGRSIAQHFSSLVEEPDVSPFNRYFDDTVVKLMTGLNLPRGYSLIDIGCGDGKMLNRIAASVPTPANSLAGFDISKDMVRIANEKHPDFSILQGDMRNLLPGVQNSADVITCINAVHYLPSLTDVVQSYSTAFRLLKPGGFYILATGDHAATALWRGMSETQLKEWIDNGRSKMDWSMPDRYGEPVFRLGFYPYLNEEHSALAKAGFSRIKMIRNFPPGENIKKYNPKVYKMLSTMPIFVFFIAQKTE